MHSVVYLSLDETHSGGCVLAEQLGDARSQADIAATCEFLQAVVVTSTQRTVATDSSPAKLATWHSPRVFLVMKDAKPKAQRGFAQ